MVAFINDDFVPVENATVHVSDLSIQRGYGVFDFLKVSGNHPFFINDYLDRFFHSASILRLPMPLDRDKLRSVIRNLITRNDLRESGIKMILTGGYSADGYLPASPNLIITQHELVLPSPALIDKGVDIITHEYVRDLPEAKSINYTMGIWLSAKLNDMKAYDVLYFSDGLVSEFPRSNFFIVRKSGQVATPRTNVLKGVTRKNVLALAEQTHGAVEDDITIEEIFNASEAFITSTTKRILPVVSIDGCKIGGGVPGPVAKDLLRRLIDLEVADARSAEKRPA